jgi:hypothetical protein
MKSVFIIVAGLCIGGAVFAAGGADDLIRNRDFEEQTVKGWKRFGLSSRDVAVTRDLEKAHSGFRACSIQKSPDEEWGFLWQRLDGKVTWGSKIRLSVWVSSEGTGSGRAFLAVSIKAKESYDVLGGDNISVTPGRDWQQIILDYVIPGPGEIPELAMAHVEVSLGLMGRTSEGPVYFDDVEVEITKPAQ